MFFLKCAEERIIVLRGNNKVYITMESELTQHIGVQQRTTRELLPNYSCSKRLSGFSTAGQ
jgi:hypothetical protein